MVRKVMIWFVFPARPISPPGLRFRKEFAHDHEYIVPPDPQGVYGKNRHC
jgi:hypothetical protein